MGGIHKVFEGSANASFGIEEDTKHIESKGGNMTVDINGLSGEIFSMGGLVKMGLRAAGQILLSSDDGSLVIELDVAANTISLIIGGTIRLVLNGTDFSINLFLGDVGIKIITPGIIGLQIDASTCISPKQIMEIIKMVLEVFGLLGIPGLPGIDAIYCDSTWTWSGLPGDYEPPW